MKGSSYRESGGIASLSDLAIGMVEYIIDPAYWVPEGKQARTDLKGFPIS